MGKIILKDINKHFGNNHVLKDINLKIEEGDFMTLLGPSGCGKTTTLRVIAGLENPEKGIVKINNKKVADGEQSYYIPSSNRNLNLVFQSYALWPHMSVFENVSFGLEVMKLSKEVIRNKVEEALNRLQILEFMDRYPSELSGGQQQRVAIARAIVTEPDLLLLDEPLSNLDAKLRVEMRTELKRLHQELNTTIVYVTHDQVEALTMSTKIAVFFDGELVQIDTPEKIYRAPSDLRVAEFIGNPTINFIEAEGKEKGDKFLVSSKVGKLVYEKPFKHASNVVLALKPEDIKIHSNPLKKGFKCKVYSVLPAGSETLIYVKLSESILLIKEIGETKYKENDEVWITFPEDKINIYNKETGKRLVFKK